jgi:hypothetical protein
VAPSDRSTPPRIAAARARAESVKTALLAAAVIAFFVAMGFERGADSSSASNGDRVSTQDSEDDFGFFDQGDLAPSEGAPSTSTGTS